MHKIKFLIIATIMTLYSNGQALTPNDFADKIITAFKSKNFQILRPLLIDTSDYKELLNDFFKNNNIADTERKEFAEKEKFFADSADTQFQKEFDRLIKKGEKIGVDWTQIKKSKFVYKEDKPIDSGRISLSGHLNFIYKNTTYVIFGIEIMALSSGYKVSNIRTVLKGGIEQYVDPDLLDDEDL